MARDYTTWEEDFLTDKCELHGVDEALVATIEPFGGSWQVKNAAGEVVALRPDKKTAQRVAEALLL